MTKEETLEICPDCGLWLEKDHCKSCDIKWRLDFTQKGS